jgi:hypothetical protein
MDYYERKRRLEAALATITPGTEVFYFSRYESAEPCLRKVARVTKTLVILETPGGASDGPSFRRVSSGAGHAGEETKDSFGSGRIELDTPDLRAELAEAKAKKEREKAATIAFASISSFFSAGTYRAFSGGSSPTPEESAFLVALASVLALPRDDSGRANALRYAAEALRSVDVVSESDYSESSGVGPDRYPSAGSSDCPLPPVTPEEVARAYDEAFAVYGAEASKR